MGGSGVEAKFKPTDFDSCEIVPNFIYCIDYYLREKHVLPYKVLLLTWHIKLPTNEI